MVTERRAIKVGEQNPTHQITPNIGRLLFWRGAPIEESCFGGQNLEVVIFIIYLEGNWYVSGRVPRLRNLALDGQGLEIAIVEGYPKGNS